MENANVTQAGKVPSVTRSSALDAPALTTTLTSQRMPEAPTSASTTATAMVKEPAAQPETAKELPESVTTRTSRLMTSVTTPLTNMKRAATRVDVKTTVSAMEEEHVTGSDFVGEPQDSSKKRLYLRSDLSIKCFMKALTLYISL